MRLVLYTRASTDKQAASPHTQEASCRVWCEEHGHEIVRVYHEEFITRKSTIERRTALPQLVAEIKKRKDRAFDGIIVWRTDRLFGNQAEFHRLLSILDQNKCEIISVMDPVRRNTAAERFMTSVMADAASYERELISERVYAHHITKFLQGKWMGGRMSLGLTWDTITGVFTANERAADVIMIFELYVASNGRRSDVVKDLNRQGILSPGGQYWSGQAVACLLRNPIYRGILRYADREIDASHIVPRIVSETLTNQVDNLLSLSKKRGFHPRTIASSRAYSGMLYCSECGELMTSHGQHNRRHWVCRVKQGFSMCISKQVSTLYIDDLLGPALRCLTESIAADLHAAVERKQPPKISNRNKGSKTRMEAEKNRTKDLYVRGYINDVELEERMADLETRIKAIDTPQQAQKPIPAEVITMLSTLSEDWSLIPEAETRTLLLSIGAKIKVCTRLNCPIWIELRTRMTEDVVRVEGEQKGRWGVKITDVSKYTL